jgi:thiosulfate/3-mercaptopyruvate sulfurtransferase
MNVHAVTVGVAALTVCAIGADAQRAVPGAGERQVADSVIVSPAWLAPRLGDRDLVVIFVGARGDYDAGHIPGARFLPASAFTAQAHETGHESTLMTELPPLARLDSALEAIGVSNSSRIVIHAGMTPGARLFVTLEHAGLGARASILDGGLTRWREEGRPLVRDVPVVERGTLTLHPRSDVIADLATVRSATSGVGVRILDARLPQFYSGADAGQMPRAGHIPTAANLPYTSALGAQASFRTIGELRELFAGAGVKSGERVITYCHIGMQASVLYVAARAAGFDARMYDGSFDEWSRKAELAVVKSP